METMIMTNDDRQAFRRTVTYVRGWCRTHKWEVGVGEMALGAAILAAGVQNGAIEMGKELVGSAVSGFNIESGIGSALGGSVGAALGGWLGSIGVTALGGAIAVPAVALTLGAAAVLGAAGYAAGDVVHNFLHPAIDAGQLLANASLLAVGTALLIDGARRVVRDPRARAAASHVRDGVIHLRIVAAEVVARNVKELATWSRHLLARLHQAADGRAISSAVITGTGGVAIGSAASAGAVTILGSHTLGAAALSLGLISAPVWPVIVGGALGCGLGYAGWRALSRRVDRSFKQAAE